MMPGYTMPPRGREIAFIGDAGGAAFFASLHRAANHPEM